MTRKKKVTIGIMITVLAGLWILEGRRITFSFECIEAETDLDNNFRNNKSAFFDLIPLVQKALPIQFEVHSKDTIYLSFQDTSTSFDNLFIDSNYTIKSGTKSTYQINDKGCLLVIDKDTVEVCNHGWQILFIGHYKDNRIDNLLNYYGWIRPDFEQIVEKIQSLNCYGFAKEGQNFKLSYNIVSYSKDGILHCFGHSDGYFDYLYTVDPDSFFWQSSLEHLEGNFYGIKHWSF